MTLLELEAQRSSQGTDGAPSSGPGEGGSPHRMQRR